MNWTNHVPHPEDPHCSGGNRMPSSRKKSGSKSLLEPNELKSIVSLGAPRPTRALTPNEGRSPDSVGERSAQAESRAAADVRRTAGGNGRITPPCLDQRERPARDAWTGRSYARTSVRLWCCDQWRNVGDESVPKSIGGVCIRGGVRHRSGKR